MGFPFGGYVKPRPSFLTPCFGLPRRSVSKSAAGSLTARCRLATQAIEKPFTKSGANDPAIVIDAVMAAFRAKCSRVVVVGKGTGAFMMLSRFPVGLRDRLVRAALSLTKALKPL